MAGAVTRAYGSASDKQSRVRTPLAKAPKLRACNREAIMIAAGDMFLNCGFAGTNLEAIAERAGVSRQTIYNGFASKDDLFHAICSDLVDEIIAPISRAVQDEADLRDSLVTIGENLLGTALRPKSLAIYRLVVTEAARFPDLGRSLYATGPGRAVAELAAYFRAEAARGRLRIEQPEMAAELFFGMLNGHNQLRALMGVAPRLSPARRRVLAEGVTDTFLRAFAPT
ncbi:MAG: putative Transcriptional regulator TetR [Hyphomicrobiales bacterium]|nr:putative Transcriptional regulator TetR [Hyphomicrobiales bacterium]